MSSGEEAVDSRRLVNVILNMLRKYGWQVYAVCDLSKHVSNKSTFFFRYNPDGVKQTIQNICLSLNETDKLRLIDGDQSGVDYLRAAIMGGWPQGIQNEMVYNSSYQFKLNGYPFQCMSTNQVYTTVMMMLILNGMQSLGYNLIASADVSSKYVSGNEHHDSYSVDLHSWFFERNA